MTRFHLGPLVGALLIGVVGAALAFDNGGQNATSWGPATIALAAMTVIAIAVRRELLGGRLGAAWLLSFAALAAWVAISFAWSHDRSATVIEAQRMMLYLAVVAAVVTLVGSAGITWVLSATAAIITGVCVWSLASWDSGERLVGTIGYWNALGLLAAMGVVLCLGLAASPIDRPLRVAALIAVVPTAATVYLTYSRGALIAVAVGVIGIAVARRDWQVTRSGGIAVAGLVAVVVVTAVLVGGQLAGQFEGRSAHSSSSDPARFLSASGTGRAALWRVAWVDYEAHPALGIGANGWGRTWYQLGDARWRIAQTHNLYLETLSELGPIGLALLLVALGIPMAAAFGSRGDPLKAAAFGCFLAFAVHTFFDYDWQVPAVVVVALVSGGCLVASRDGGLRLSRPASAAFASILVLVGAAAFVGFLGVRAETSAAANLTAKRFGAASAEATTAARWQPWSATPLIIRGQALIAAGHTTDGMRDLRTAVSRDPGNYLGWLAMANATTGEARYDALRQAVLLAPLAPDLRAICKRGGAHGACRLRHGALTRSGA